MIRVTHIDKYYNRGKGSEVHALRDVNLTIQQGERIGIIGTSGSGKSTLLKVLGLLEVPDNGDYWLNDENVVRSKEKEKANLRSRQIGFVMQDFALMEDRSVLENVMPADRLCHAGFCIDGRSQRIGKCDDAAFVRSAIYMAKGKRKSV